MIFFSAASLLITIPSGIQIFAWTATVVKGRPVLASPMLYILGFVVVFVVGGVTGVMFAAIPFDQQVTDSYFVVAHFHYVLMGGAVFPIFGGIHYWFPKITGRMLNERLARFAFWVFFIGFNLTFFPMHVAGLLGMPRRVYTYEPGLGWDAVNLIETIGAFVLATGILLTAINVLVSRRSGREAGPDPWGANTLEWATTSPPQHYNFPVIPRVSSADPNWDIADRAEDAMTMNEGEWILPGHETPATTNMDAELDKVLEMPSESPWPLALAASLGVFFLLGLLDHWVAAGASLVLVAGALVGWHWTEPEEEAS
jgi:cytochrome c oxidase subunit 1/cytochrome c oxidase subunit I+III